MDYSRQRVVATVWTRRVVLTSQISVYGAWKSVTKLINPTRIIRTLVVCGSHSDETESQCDEMV